MKRITNRSEFDELIEKINGCIEFYEKNKFSEKIYNLMLDNGEKIRICFDNNTVAHLLGIDTEYLKTTNLFKGKSYEILKKVCNDSYRLYTMIKDGHLIYGNFISDFAFEKVENFEQICGIDLDNIEFVCQYKKENSYITGHNQLEGDYYIAYKNDDRLIIIGLKKKGEYYYPMTNRVLDLNDEKSKSFLDTLLKNQSITMPTYYNYNHRNLEGHNVTQNRSNVYLDYNKKATIIKNLLEIGEEYECSVDVSVGYGFIIDKLISKFDSNKKTSSGFQIAFQIAFEYILQGKKINIKKVKNNCGDLPEEIIGYMESYNQTINTKASKEGTNESSYRTDINELESLKKQLLEQTARIKELEQINAGYQERENTIKRVLSMQ